MNKPVYYKDLLSGHQKFTEQELGRKGLSLALLVMNNVPVPPFFILPPNIFSGLISTIFQETDISSLEDFRRKIDSSKLSAQDISIIGNEYQKLSGFGQAWVAVRSSIVAELNQEVNFSGILNSILNVRGINEIEDAVKNVYSSFFSDRTYDYLKKNKISYGDVKTAIIVQKMVQAEVSGIMYTYDPITLDKSHVSIEAVFGLGDVLADGSLNPDIYTVEKESLEIVEKKIVPQDWMKVRKVGDKDALGHLQKVSISKVWQYSQKLDDSLVRELTKLADSIEKAMGGPQIIEWAMERGSIYILQTKHAAQNAYSEKGDVAKINHKVSSMSDINSFSEISENIEIKTSKAPAESTSVKSPTLPPQTLLFTANGASSGIAYGEALVIANSADVTETVLEELKTTISKKHILVTDEFSEKLEVLFAKAGGVITNYGGINSDAAINAREQHIPAVVGSRIATSFLQTGYLIKIDGASGAVYRVDFIPTHLPNKIESHIDSKEKKKLQELDIEMDIKDTFMHRSSTQMGSSKQPITVFLTDSPFGNAAFINTIKAANGTHAQKQELMLTITTATKLEISRILKLKKTTSADIYILIAGNPSLASLLKTKRALAANKIRRSKRIKFIIGIDSIYGILNLSAICDMTIDGILYMVSPLSQSYMPNATNFDDKFWQMISDSIKTIKNKDISFIGLELPKNYFTVPLQPSLKNVMLAGVNNLVFTEKIDHATEDDVTEIVNEVVKGQLG